MDTMANRSYRWLFWLLALIGLTVDQVSKYGVFAWLYDGDRLEGAMKSSLGLSKSYGQVHGQNRDGIRSALSFLRTMSAPHLPYVNKGALWGTKLQLSDTTANFVFGIVSVLAALGIIYWSTRPGTARHRYLCFALGLILGGHAPGICTTASYLAACTQVSCGSTSSSIGPFSTLPTAASLRRAGLLLLEAFFATTEPEGQTATTSRRPRSASFAPTEASIRSAPIGAISNANLNRQVFDP